MKTQEARHYAGTCAHFSPALSPPPSPSFCRNGESAGSRSRDLVFSFPEKPGRVRLRRFSRILISMKPQNHPRKIRLTAMSAATLMALTAQAQVPQILEAELKKIGQIVDPGCTAKLYRPLMPVNDYNSNVTPLYTGITLARDVSFGLN